VNKYYLVGRFEWLSYLESGRAGRPDSGQYAPTVVSEKDPEGIEQGTHWSVAIDLDSAIETNTGTLVEFGFLARESTGEISKPGTRLAIMEGPHHVGWLTVVSSATQFDRG
jgi:hypothetical protein